jgi:hypothetical protein
MFNYFLVIFGIVAAGVVSAVDKGKFFIAILLCVGASILGLIFRLLDKRNQALVWLGEDILVKLENETIFAEAGQVEDRFGNKVPCGILGGLCGYLYDAFLGKHRVWLRIIISFVSILFAIAAVLIAVEWRKAASMIPEKAANIQRE